MKDKVVLFLASAFYSGYFPVASGTFATLLPGVPVFLAVALLPPTGYLAVTVALTLLSVYVSSETEKILAEKDPHKVTLDEVAGFLVAMFALRPTLSVVVAGFLLFRFFDVVKLFPARWLENNCPRGWGVTLDDIAAGLWTHLVLRLLLKF